MPRFADPLSASNTVAMWRPARVDGKIFPQKLERMSKIRGGEPPRDCPLFPWISSQVFIRENSKYADLGLAFLLLFLGHFVKFAKFCPIITRPWPNLFRLVQTCFNLLKHFQTSSNLFKLVQTCSNLFKTI